MQNMIRLATNLNILCLLIAPWAYLMAYFILRISGTINTARDWIYGGGIFLVLLILMFITKAVTFGRCPKCNKPYEYHQCR